MATVSGRWNCFSRVPMKRLSVLAVVIGVLILGSLSAHASVAWVSASHTVCTQTSSGTSSETCALPAATTAGNDIVVGVAWQNTGATINHVYGSGATSYFPLYATVCGSGECVATLVCHHCAAQTAVTTTMSEGTAFVATVEEYSGVQALGITGTNTSSSTAPGLTMTTGDANDWTVCTTASTGTPTSGTGNLRNAASAGSIAGAMIDNTASSPSSLACTGTIASGAWAATGIELRSVAPRTYIWPDCDTTHPCVVYHIDTPAVATSQIETLNGFKVTAVPSSPGNLLVLTVTHLSSTSVTVSDNNNGSWQTAVKTTNSGDGVATEVHYVCGAAAGTNVITVQLSAPVTSGQVLQFSYNEVSGIAPSSCLDTASGANGLTHGLQPGALATSSNGDLVYNFAETSYNYPEFENPIGWVMPDDNSALLMENDWDMFASQVSVQATHGSYNPTLYVNTDPNDRNWNSVAAAFIASSGAGTQPTGIHVTRVMHYYNPGLPLTPAWIAYPSTGNAVVITSAYPSGQFGGNMTDVADTQGDTWTRTPYTSYAADPQLYYTCLGAQASSRDLTIDWLPDTGTTHMIVYDVAGAATTGGASGCVGATVNDIQGNQASTANAPMLDTPVITPESSSSVILAVNQTGLGPPSGTLTPGVVFVSIWATGMTDSTNWDSGDCYGYIYSTSTSPIDFSWSMANYIEDPNGGSGYDGAAIEILPAAGSSSGPTTPTLSVTNSPVIYNGSPQAANVSASVPGTVGNILYSGSSAVPTAAGTYSITANFTPQNTSQYSSLTGASAGSFVINKATPAVTLSSSLNPSTVGALVTLTATVPSSATGSVTFYNGTSSLGTVTLSGGSATLSTTTLPGGSDSITAAYSGDSNHNTASGTLIQTVNTASKTTPTITWATPAAIDYGTALSAAQLDATASVPGSFLYSPAATTVLTAGGHTLSVTFTPADTTDYTTATGSVTLTVNKATPSITTLPTPSAIAYGQTLTSSTLSGGSASTGGSFAWTTPSTLPFAGSEPEGITFTPSDSTDYNTAVGQVTLTVNKAMSSVTTPPAASAITYGQTLTSSTLSGGTASVSGSFTWQSPTALPFSGTQPESVMFVPSDSTDYTTATVLVAVIVNKATPSIKTLPTASAITYGQMLALSTLSGGAASVSGSFAWTSPLIVLPGGNQSESVTFSPTDATDYTTVSTAVNVQVNLAVPTIGWATPPAINYGTALSATQLDAMAMYGGAPVAGTYSYSPALGTVLTAGSHTLTVTFTPSNTAGYAAPPPATVTLQVNKATPSITTLPTAGPIIYGQTLASSVLTGGSGSVGGSFSWTTPAIQPVAGSLTAGVTFTPSDSTDYNAVTGSVTVTVNKATPKLSWATPAAINYGTALSATQLDASSTVPGTFVYSPIAGTVLGSGSHTLTVTFTPTDTADYTTATDSVTLVVHHGVHGFAPR